VTSRRLLWMGALLLLAPLSLLFALAVGSSDLGLAGVWSVLWGHPTPLAHIIVVDLRLPRAAAAFAVGALLGLAGTLMQALLRNPLADPYVLGISGGAAVAALVAMLVRVQPPVLEACAFLGALGSMFLVFTVARGRGSWNTARVILTGVVLAAGWGALVSFILAVSPAQALPGLLFWLMGDLSHATAPWTGLAVAALGLALSWPLAPSLNVLVRGELQAAALGISVGHVRWGIYVLASLLTATAVTIGGTVGFIGLVVPHTWRLAAGGDHRLLLPASALLGGTLLSAADTLARSVMAPRQLPVGILTAALGVPLFLYLLRRGPE
jgi:iron complex transport system permease protein